MDFAAHVRRVLHDLDRMIEDARCTGLLLHSGVQRYYQPRDRPVPFLPQPHFLRLCPAEEPDVWLRYVPGKRPRVVRTLQQGYWDADPAPWPETWRAAFDVVEVSSPLQARQELGALAGFAFVGEPVAAATAQLEPEQQNPEGLLAALAWARSKKTPYEQAQIRAAGIRAAAGHGVVARLALQGRSERALHAAYLAATRQLEHDTPYTNIIAWDSHAATLHYAQKQEAPPDPGHVLLIDAGAREAGYASDITRTYALPGAHPVFRELLEGMQGVQRELVRSIAPSVSFVELHRRAERRVCELLRAAGALRCEVEAALDAGLARHFLPHGLGHMLGIEVHDVAGRQREERGGSIAPPPDDVPHLRMTRTLAPGHVVTVEPGLYFIPRLLEPLRNSPHAQLLHWPLLEQLMPCGGIRIEDDVLVTDEGHEDLTHQPVADALALHAARGPESGEPGYR